MDYASMPAKIRIDRSRSQAMRHPEFCLMAGVMMIGRVYIEAGVPTAATDGVNTYFGPRFTESLTEQEVNFLVLHEEGHKAFRQLFMYRHLCAIDKQRANMAMDYIINGWIIDTDPKGTFARMPKGGLYNPDWSKLTVQEVFDLLKGQGGQGQGPGEGDGPLDNHDWESASKLTEEEEKDLAKEIDGALREGTILVGKAQGKINRRITEMLQPKIDWREVLREFVNTLASGKDLASWRQFNRRYTSSGLYLPTTISESMGEIAIGIDTSGSIDEEQLAAAVSEFVSICESVKPSRVRVLWWDTHVAKEQVIEGDTSKLAHTLEPAGGGGTRAGCVSDYILKKGYTPEAVVMFTDGYLEDRIKWDIATPTMWVVNGADNFNAPRDGRVVNY
jgi:predicted metal-dependent peptidase